MIGSLQNIAPSVENATEYDVNREVNNGRGPVDFKVSKGSKDSTLVEFKLASNTKLRKNLENQVEIYKKANCTNRAIKVILYFTEEEYAKVTGIVNDLKLHECDDIVLINAIDNKPSASTVGWREKGHTADIVACCVAFLLPPLEGCQSKISLF